MSKTTCPNFMKFLLAALRAAQRAGISVTQRPILMFIAPQGRYVAPIGVKFGTEEGTQCPLLHAKFHPHRCNVSPLRVEKPQNRPLSKLNTGRFALRAMLPVNSRNWKTVNDVLYKDNTGLRSFHECLKKQN